MFGLLDNRFLARIGSRLALAAIALHLVFSFGHLHAPAARALPSVAAADQQTPAPSPFDAADCAICANIVSFGSLNFGAPVALAVSGVWVRLVLGGQDRWIAASTDYHLFHSRAPPTH
jgi:hypothetical protein